MEEANTFVKAITDLSPPVSLMLALNFVMLGIKRFKRIPNEAIPWIAPAIGAFAYPFVSDPASVTFAVRYPVAAQAVTGFLMGWAAVGAHQWFKTFLDRFGFKTGDTEFKTKPIDVEPKD